MVKVVSGRGKRGTNSRSEDTSQANDIRVIQIEKFRFATLEKAKVRTSRSSHAWGWRIPSSTRRNFVNTKRGPGCCLPLESRTSHGE